MELKLMKQVLHEPDKQSYCALLQVVSCWLLVFFYVFRALFVISSFRLWLYSQKKVYPIDSVCVHFFF